MLKTRCERPAAAPPAVLAAHGWLGPWQSSNSQWLPDCRLPMAGWPLPEIYCVASPCSLTITYLHAHSRTGTMPSSHLPTPPIHTLTGAGLPLVLQAVLLGQMDSVRRELVEVIERYVPHVMFGKEVVREVFAFAQVRAHACALAVGWGRRPGLAASVACAAQAWRAFGRTRVHSARLVCAVVYHGCGCTAAADSCTAKAVMCGAGGGWMDPGILVLWWWCWVGAIHWAMMEPAGHGHLPSLACHNPIPLESLFPTPPAPAAVSNHSGDRGQWRRR